MSLWIEDTRKSGRVIPPPSRFGPNGRLLLRLPKSLHARVAQAATRDGVSVNSFVTAAVAVWQDMAQTSCSRLWLRNFSALALRVPRSA